MRHELTVVRIRAGDVQGSDVITSDPPGPWRVITNVETADNKVVLRSHGWDQGFHWYKPVFVQAKGPLVPTVDIG